MNHGLPPRFGVASMYVLARYVLIIVVFAGMFAVTTPAHAFIRGDADSSGTLNLSDPLTVLGYLFQGAQAPSCFDAADADDSGAINLSDALLILNVLFGPGSTTLPAPYPEDGADPTPDGMVCEGPLFFETLSQGSVSNTAVNTTEVILDATTWAAFWSGHSNEPLPVVDFDVEMVVAIRGTFDSLGFSYNVDELLFSAGTSGDELAIEYTFGVPGIFLPQLSQPHHIVRTDRVDATYQFNQFDAPPPP